MTENVQKIEQPIAENVHVIGHPLVQHKLTLMRDKDCQSNMFRLLLKEIAFLLCYELLRDLPTKNVEIETPLEVMQAPALAGENMCIVSILRAGNGFLDGLLELVPTARVGFIGLYRDPKTLLPVEYYLKFPDEMPKRQIIVVDPMLATGGSAIAAIDRIKDHGATNIKFLCLIAAPEGIKAFSGAHPDVEIYTAAVDRELNDHSYILPGIGDAGDRIYGTK